VAEPRARRTRATSAVPREVVLGIDATEQKVAYWLVGFGAVLSLILAYLAVFVGHVTVTAEKKAVNGTCPPLANYDKVKLVGDTCHYSQVTSLGGLAIDIAILAVAMAAMYYFARRKRRSGIIFICFGLFLALSGFLPAYFIPGLIYLGAAVWLMLRAWRLQKYGVVSAREIAQIKRDPSSAKKSDGKSVPMKPVTENSDSPRRAAEPSKRYTPKKTTKKRR